MNKLSKIVNKIKTGGLKDTIKWISCCLADKINRVSLKLFRRLRIHDNLIVLESEGDFSDNSQALYQYMTDNGYLKKYNVVWLVNNKTKFKAMRLQNTKFCSKKWGRCHVNTSYYLGICKYYIYDHNNLLYDARRKEQLVIFLGHGCTFKAPSKDAMPCLSDEVYVTGKLCRESVAAWCNAKVETLFDIGYPRLDYWFFPENDAQEKFKIKYGLNQYSCVFLWMPTFRKSVNKNLSEDYFQSTTGLPILMEEEQLEQFDKYLCERNYLCIFKIHHLQAKQNSFRKPFTNIILINDEAIYQYNLQLYQFIPLSDALVTDYSSVANDYLLLDRPIIFTLDDYEEYKKSRGFCVDNAIDFFAGYHVYDVEELQSAMDEIGDGIDKFKNDRQKLLPMAHTYTDGHAAKRILDRLNIKL